jgi:hypothetical protein
MEEPLIPPGDLPTTGPTVFPALIALIIVLALGYSTRSEQDSGLITRHLYNNRYNDAPGAREDHFE